MKRKETRIETLTDAPQWEHPDTANNQSELEEWYQIRQDNAHNLRRNYLKLKMAFSSLLKKGGGAGLAVPSTTVNS